MIRNLIASGRCLSAAFAVAFCLAASARPAAAAPTFTNLHEVSITTHVAQSITPIITGGYRMYLTSGSYQIVSASSTDLVNWTLESGIRLTTSPASVDTSSITAVSVHMSTSSDFYRMYYVGISSVSKYSILSATSTDGLTFGKESAFKLQIATGAAHIGQLHAFDASPTELALFHVAENNNGNNPANYRVFVSTSNDGGLTFSTSALALGNQALGVSVSTLTDGKTRMYYTQPLSGNATGAQVLSAISSNGLSFTAETGVRLSTTATTNIGPPIVYRSTNGFQWNLYSSFTQDGSSIAQVSRSLAKTPVINSFSPSQANKGQIGVAYTITGEIFDTTANPTLTFTQSGSSFSFFTIATITDLQIDGTFDMNGIETGFVNLFVTNSDGGQGSATSVMEVKLPPGSVTIVDNLFRPLKGGSAAIEIQVSEAGDIVARLYSVSGTHVATLMDGPAPEGATNLTWNGRNASGAVVASGVYLLFVSGPGLNTVQKMVIIK